MALLSSSTPKYLTPCQSLARKGGKRPNDKWSRSVGHASNMSQCRGVSPRHENRGEFQEYSHANFLRNIGYSLGGKTLDCQNVIMFTVIFLRFS